MLSIRAARPDDVSRMTDIINAAFVVERRFKDGDRTSVPEVAELLRAGVFLVGEDEGEMIACVFVSIDGHTGYFGMLAVDPARQGAEHGKCMREAAEQYCREQGCTEMTLMTVNLREELPPYYARFGYRIIGTEPAESEHFNQPVHFIKMAKAL